MEKMFYRVRVRLIDDEPGSELAFDFNDAVLAMNIATRLFNACDIVKEWVEVIPSEVTTTNSPMWRWKE